jgi:SNF2 family DNA or RNA helicase
MSLITTPGRQYKPHQLIGINWMLARERAGGGLLCDDMGLGKTEQILGLILNTTKKSTLLLCPKPLIAQWVRDCIRCKFAVHVASKGAWSPVNRTDSPHSVFITNYDTVSSKQYLFNQPFQRICLDEAHQYLCNKKGKMYQRVAAIKRETTWAITATPVVNSTKDLLNLLSLVGFSSNELDEIPIDVLISQAVLHRSMDELRPVLTNLPSAAKHTVMSLEFETEEEREFYQGIQGKLVKRWQSLDRDQTTMRFQLLMKLRQLSIHPQIYIGARKREPFGYARDSWYAPSTKFTAIQKLVTAHTNIRWIIFCQFRAEMDLLDNELSDTCTVYQYHGGLTEEEKASVLKERGRGA